MPRLSKRQQREQEELEQLAAQKAAAAASSPEASDDEGEEQVEQKEVGGAFGALNLGDDDGEESEEEVEEVVAVKKKSKSKKKKKKATKTPVDSAATTDGPPTPISAATSKKGGKQQGADSPRKAAAADDGMDEIDRALAELAAKGGEAAPVQSSEGSRPARLEPKWQAVKEVFSFEPKLLDAEAELRKMFGSKVISTTSTPQRSMHHARFANNPHHTTSLKRSASYLANPESGWYPSAGVLKLSRYTGPEFNNDEGEWYTFDHSWEYRAAQLSFLEVLQQADGNRLYDVLQNSPYHVDTHMQLSEMSTQQGDLGASSTHLSKALYALSAPLPVSFPSGSFRLPYSQIENRAFYLGISRKVALLVKRGTMRAACEWAKLGLGCSGGEDPVGMLLFVDFLAPKARQNEWFLSLLDSIPKAYTHQPEMKLEAYPGLAYAKALCLRNIEEEKKQDDNKSTAALKSAILRFPMVVPLLFSTLGGNVPPSLLTHRRAQVDGEFSNNPSYLLQLLSALYSVRSGPLWKPPPVLAWLQKTVNAVAPSLDDSSLEDVRVGEKLWSQGPWEKGVAPAGIIRAAYLAEIPSVRPYLPPSVMSGTSYSFDPVPPSRTSGATFYDDAYFAPLHQQRSFRRRQGGGRAGVAGGAGGGGARMAEMAAAMRDQLANLLGLGPAGPQVDLNPELRAQLLAELEQLEAGGRGEVPGGFPGMEDNEHDEDDYTDEEFEEGEEGEEGQEQDRGNFLGRLGALFGGGGANPPAAQQ